ncbi:MAG TPA: hypothetical protein VJ963_06335 [Bacteroidales bacterium]|nr:hypothetical protein [Bacteroidales bacterium]
MTFDFLKLLKVVEESQLDIFSTTELARIVDYSPADIQNYLETLSNNGLITRLERGKYCRIYIRDKFVIGSRIINGGVVSHQSALALHELDKDIPGEVYVSSCHQKVNKTFSGTRFNFIRIRPHKDFGSMVMQRNNHRISVTDLEKTIIDCFDLPRYVRSYSDLMMLFPDTHFNQARLFDYGLRLGNISVLKRIAYLLDESNPARYSSFNTKVRRLVNDRYTLLDPSGPEKGPFNVRWRIRNNVI